MHGHGTIKHLNLSRQIQFHLHKEHSERNDADI